MSNLTQTTDVYRMLTIENDVQADIVLMDYKEQRDEEKRLQSILDAEIEALVNKKQEITESFKTKTEQHMNLLADYARRNPGRVTKTEKKLKLPCGTLVWKAAGKKIVRDEDKLLEFAKTYGTAFIKVKESVDWASMKVLSVEVDDHYEFATPEGELVRIDGVSLIPEPEKFEIK